MRLALSSLCVVLLVGADAWSQEEPPPEIVEEYAVGDVFDGRETVESARVAAKVLVDRMKLLEVEGDAELVFHEEGIRVRMTTRGVSEGDWDRVRASLIRPGGLRFEIAATDADGIDLRREEERLVAALKARGGPMEEASPVELFRLTKDLRGENEDVRFRWRPIHPSYREEYERIYPVEPGTERAPYILVRIEAEPRYRFDESHIENAERCKDHQDMPAFSIRFSDEAGKAMARFTEANLDRILTIVVDGSVRSVPRIMASFSHHAQISAGSRPFSEEELDLMELWVRAGSFPCTLERITDESP